MEISVNWCRQIEQINLNLTEADISRMTKEAFKNRVSIRIRHAAFSELIQTKGKHSKMEHNVYKKLELQNYMKSPFFDKEASTMLLALKTRTVRGIKNDFKGMFTDLDCPLGCGSIDTLQHILTCKVLQGQIRSNSITTNKVQFSDIFCENIVKQKQVTHMHIQLMNIRQKLM